MNRIRNRKINWMPFLCAGLALSAGGLPAAPVQPAASPNIIFILTDDQGWADLNTPMDPNVPEGSSSFSSTPAMSRLAAEGMRFPNGYASAPICTPTRRSIQFGMTPPASAARSLSAIASVRRAISPSRRPSSGPTLLTAAPTSASGASTCRAGPTPDNESGRQTRNLSATTRAMG